MLTGFSALTQQVVWQRVISIHSGVDLSSSTTVVAGVLAGLGLGSLIGGWIADRVGPARCALWLCGSNLAIGAFAWWSMNLLYGLYREVAPDIASPMATAGFNLLLLLVPTTLQGLSLPLVAKIVTEEVGDAGSLVGRLSGINTLSAALGSIAAGWYLIGNFGFVTTVRLSAVMNLVAAAVVFATRRVGVVSPGEKAPRSPAVVPARSWRSWIWPLVYCVTGALALAYQIVFFRLIDVVMRSNSYSFSLVLGLYLGFWGLGAWMGARALADRQPTATAFCGLQLAAAVTAAFAVGGFIWLAGALGTRGAISEWLAGNGFAGGFDLSDPFRAVLFGLIVPAALLGPPIMCAGASFPVIQGIVVREMSTIGRRTGVLGFANLAGNVVGVVVAGFIAIDLIGTSGTLRLLTAMLGMLSVIGLALHDGPRRAWRAGGAAAAVVLAVAVVPSPSQLWTTLHGGHRRLFVAEDHSCVAAAQRFPDGRSKLFINGAEQNGFPFDRFHVLIGLTAALVRPATTDALAIGFGAGSTSYSILLDPRVKHLTTVELCGGDYEVADRLRADGVAEFERLASDQRHRRITADGRRFLAVDPRRFDLVVVDTLRPTSANSGSHYSKEFYELVAQRLSTNGVLAQWAPTERVLNSVAQVFPHVVTLRAGSDGDTTLYLASRAPIDVDRSTLLRRFDAIDPVALSAEQRGDLRRWFASWSPRCVVNGRTRSDVPSDRENSDLRPRDEYFVNNESLPASADRSTCERSPQR